MSMNWIYVIRLTWRVSLNKNDLLLNTMIHIDYFDKLEVKKESHFVELNLGFTLATESNPKIWLCAGFWHVMVEHRAVTGKRLVMNITALTPQGVPCRHASTNCAQSLLLFLIIYIGLSPDYQRKRATLQIWAWYYGTVFFISKH